MQKNFQEDIFRILEKENRWLCPVDRNICSCSDCLKEKTALQRRKLRLLDMNSSMLEIYPQSEPEDKKLIKFLLNENLSQLFDIRELEKETVYFKEGKKLKGLTGNIRNQIFNPIEEKNFKIKNESFENNLKPNSILDFFVENGDQKSLEENYDKKLGEEKDYLTKIKTSVIDEAQAINKTLDSKSEESTKTLFLDAQTKLDNIFIDTPKINIIKEKSIESSEAKQKIQPSKTKQAKIKQEEETLKSSPPKEDNIDSIEHTYSMSPNKFEIQQVLIEKIKVQAGEFFLIGLEDSQVPYSSKIKL